MGLVSAAKGLVGAALCAKKGHAMGRARRKGNMLVRTCTRCPYTESTVGLARARAAGAKRRQRKATR